jgi:hypothetical protein
LPAGGGGTGVHSTQVKWSQPKHRYTRAPGPFIGGNCIAGIVIAPQRSQGTADPAGDMLMIPDQP